MDNLPHEPQPGFSTWNLFRELGFQHDSEVLSDDAPGLSIQCGNLDLSASWVLSLRFEKVVLLSGTFADGRTGALIESEMPLAVESREQGIAWLVWILDNATGRRCQPPNGPEWIAEGRKHIHLLPWERERAEYAARPCCSIERNWMKLALKSLAEHLTTVDAETPVDFSFDGSVLTIRCAAKVCVTPAKGQAWNQVFSMPAGKLHGLPKRLMRDPIEVSVWQSCLTIGNRRYSGVATVGTDS